jgi:hypothetical protein
MGCVDQSRHTLIELTMPSSPTADISTSREHIALMSATRQNQVVVTLQHAAKASILRFSNTQSFSRGRVLNDRDPDARPVSRHSVARTRCSNPA